MHIIAYESVGVIIVQSTHTSCDLQWSYRIAQIVQCVLAVGSLVSNSIPLGATVLQFSSSPNQTHLIQIIKDFKITRNFKADVIWSL